MDLKVLPNEVYVTEFGALIRTRCPKEYVTDQMIHQRVTAANLSAGDTVRVQCMNHDRSVVLHYVEYLVYARTEEIRKVEINDVRSNQFQHSSYSIIKSVDWKSTPAAEPQQSIGADYEIKWNPGKKVHQVIKSGDVVYEDSDKEKVEKFVEAA